MTWPPPPPPPLPEPPPSPQAASRAGIPAARSEPRSIDRRLKPCRPADAGTRPARYSDSVAGVHRDPFVGVRSDRDAARSAADRDHGGQFLQACAGGSSTVKRFGETPRTGGTHPLRSRRTAAQRFGHPRGRAIRHDAPAAQELLRCIAGATTPAASSARPVSAPPSEPRQVPSAAHGGFVPRLLRVTSYSAWGSRPGRRTRPGTEPSGVPVCTTANNASEPSGATVPCTRNEGSTSSARTSVPVCSRPRTSL